MRGLPAVPSSASHRTRRWDTLIVGGALPGLVTGVVLAPLFDPPRGGAWPGESEPRISSRPPLYALERRGVGGLGSEGDLLRGWRAGGAIAADLA